MLLLQSLERGNLNGDYFTSNFRLDLNRLLPETVTFTEVDVNPAGFVETPEEAIVAFLRSAFSNRPQPDLVMSIGGPAAAFAQRYAHQIFPESPILFGAADERFLPSVLAANETAVAVHNDSAAIIETILQLLPRTSTVFVITGSGPRGRFWREQFEGDFRRFSNRLQFIWSEDLTFATILSRVSTLPTNSAIFYQGFSADAVGAAYAEERVLAEIQGVANAPLFAGQGSTLGHGVIGGPLMPIEDLERLTATTAARILNGESPATIRNPVQPPGPPVFDARELARWGISDSRLPPGSIVRFRDPSLWDRFKWIIIGIAAVLAAQAALIGGLLLSRAKRHRAELRLRMNISELDAARTALSNLSGRLMEAQEQERARVARDLHDDLGQKVAFLSIDVTRFKEALPAAAADAREHAQRLSDGLMELAHDVQSISHRLHSSTLDYLGLPVAAKAFCRELSSRGGLELECQHANVPRSVPAGVNICLFRVMQEAVANVVKHSGASHCSVSIEGTGDALILQVTDDGHGFDIDATNKKVGLGLIGMQERLKLVNGTLTIASRPGHGTTVRAAVPIPKPSAASSIP